METVLLEPATIEEAAEALASVKDPVRPVGSGSRAGWGGSDESLVDLSTAKLNRILEHNAGDFTAVLEAGVPLAEAQRVFAGAGQWLPVDPFPGGTIGGLVATGDSGPARHRYGGVRDLVIGVTVVLSDGAVARSGGRVIKNVAGYDLAKLLTGSYGTLGLIAAVAVRLHPLPTATATAVGAWTDPDAFGAAALALARRPLEATALDAHWTEGVGTLMVRFSGRTAVARAAGTAQDVGGDAERVVEDDEALWNDQRAAQRSAEGVVLKVSGLPTDLPRLVGVADAAGATLVSRAALGLSWFRFEAGPDLAERVATARQAVAPRASTVLDGAHLVASPWPDVDPGVLAVTHRLKARFDPGRLFRPGAFVGGL